jgi:DNA-directed RNA polymerase specialized sigma24 family protein
MNALVARTTDETETSTILQRIAARDETAVKVCIDVYGDFIWAMARKFIDSPVEAAKATEEIFRDIWQYCDGARNAPSSEQKLIAMIALRRLIKTSRKARQQKSMAKARMHRTMQGAETDEVSKRS